MNPLRAIRRHRERLRVFGIDALILLAAAFGFALSVVLLGLYNVSTRIDHLPPVRWALHTAFDSSVRTWSALDGIPSEDHPMPDLSEEFLIERGASYFESGCAACHGRPGEERSLVARSMKPEPPPIGRAVGEWRPEQLYWIVRNGVKMSGMPGWPSEERHDDIWSVVAFLMVADEMDGERYRALAFGPSTKVGRRANIAAFPLLAADPPDEVARCARCHGFDGAGRRSGAFPRLDIQTEDYIAASLRAYASGERHSGIMQPFAEALSEEDIDDLAAYYGRTDAAVPKDPMAEVDPELLALGRKVVFGAGPGADERKDVPSCAACHGPWPEERDAAYPRLSGQWENYILSQLHAFEKGTRGGAGKSHLMHPVIGVLDERQMEAAAAFYASGTD